MEFNEKKEDLKNPFELTEDKDKEGYYYCCFYPTYYIQSEWDGKERTIRYLTSFDFEDLPTYKVPIGTSEKYIQEEFVVRFRKFLRETPNIRPHSALMSWKECEEILKQQENPKDFSMTQYTIPGRWILTGKVEFDK